MNNSPLSSATRREAPKRNRKAPKGTARTNAQASQREGIPTSLLEKYASAWLLHGDIEQHSLATQSNRRWLIDHLQWFLDDHGFEQCDRAALEQFFVYCRHGHESDPRGKWGDPKNRRAAAPSTIATYHRIAKTFFRWLVEQEHVEVNPFDKLPTPINRDDEIRPYDAADIDHLLNAAKNSYHATRDTALILFLLDTGVRNSECRNLKLERLDVIGRKARIEGKGDKERTIHFSARTARALTQYLRQEDREIEDFVFYGERGPLTRSGLFQIIERLGEVTVDSKQKRAKGERAQRVQAVDANIHRFRHTFAISFLRAGGTERALQMMLGHTDAKMLQRYVRFAEADVARQHGRSSPVEHHFSRRG